MGKLVGSWLRQMERKIHESLKLVSMMAVNKWNLKFPFGTFPPGKQDYLFRCSNTPEHFPWNDVKDVFLLPFNWIFQQLLVNGKQPLSTAKI